MWAAAAVLELDALSRRYGEAVALDDPTLSVPGGAICGFAGPSGAGKTTAMRIVLAADAGLGQPMLIGAVGAALVIASGTLDLAGDAVGALGAVLAWFVLGYALYSCMFAVAGALVPRQEDIRNSTAR
jgi:hypothetical protein